MLRAKDAYNKVFDFIINQIHEGVWKSGERIWVENDFVEKLGVSKSSVRKAIEELQIRGLLKKVQGSGTYVQEFNFTSGLNYTFPFEPVVGQKDLRMMLDFRKYFEYGNILLFAKQASQKEIDKLEKTLKIMEEYQYDPKIYSDADYQFHYLIAKGTQNDFIMRIFEIISKPMKELLYYQADSLGIQNGLEYHGLIIKWLKEKEYLLAAQMMLKHLEQAIDDIPK